jgi:soluble P-type ATPase
MNQEFEWMAGDLAIVFDVAGTILKMYRVAKNLATGNIIENVITSDIIMEKGGRALVVPQFDPTLLPTFQPDRLISSIFDEELIDVSCCSTLVCKDQAVEIIRNSQTKVADLQEVYELVAARCPSRYRTSGVIVDTDISMISYAICTAGRPFSGLKGVLSKLHELRADVYIASGDSMRSLLCLLDCGFQQDHIYPVSSPGRKRDHVNELKNDHRIVAMVGDGLNDLEALKAADVGILTVQQYSNPLPCLFQAADLVINDIGAVPDLIRNILYP